MLCWGEEVIQIILTGIQGAARLAGVSAQAI